MGGNSMSALQEPIKNGDIPALKHVLAKFGMAVPLLLQKQFIGNEDGCLEVDPVFTTPLKYCIECNEPECLRILLEAGGDPNEVGKGRASLLHKACKKIAIDCVKVLLEYGARVYDSDEWGVYPIHSCVAAYGDFDDSLTILDILLEAGNSTDINLKDGEYGKLPLHYAAFYGNKKICQRLLDLGVDINATDNHGRTAYQASERHKKVQEFLKEKGCDIPVPVKKNILRPIFPLFADKNRNSKDCESSTSDSSVADVGPPQTTTVEIDHHSIDSSD